VLVKSEKGTLKTKGEVRAVKKDYMFFVGCVTELMLSSDKGWRCMLIVKLKRIHVEMENYNRRGDKLYIKTWINYNVYWT
jgi:hypothetical protein